MEENYSSWMYSRNTMVTLSKEQLMALIDLSLALWEREWFIELSERLKELDS